MKTSKISLRSDKNNHEEIKKRVRTGIILKSVVVIIIVSWIILLTSCMVGLRGPRNERQGATTERHDHHDRNDHDDRHDHNEHHN